MIYYIADTHFGDERVMQLCNRPFKNIAQHDACLVDNWNKRVKSSDTVYVVGDFAFDNKSAQVIDKLNGKIHLVIGNHDRVLTDKTLDKFASINQLVIINDNGKSVALSHYPMLSYENSIYGGYHIFGHIHNNDNDVATSITKQLKNVFNAGIDVNGYKPVTLKEQIENKNDI